MYSRRNTRNLQETIYYSEQTYAVIWQQVFVQSDIQFLKPEIANQNDISNWAWWLKPVIPDTWRWKMGR
jgi:hypothetical protein